MDLRIMFFCNWRKFVLFLSIDNKDKIKEYVEKRKEAVNCECGGRYTLNHRHHHMKTKKHSDFLLSSNIT